MKNKSLNLVRVLGPWFAFAFLLAACDLSSLTGAATPVTIVITATPAQVAVNSPAPSTTLSPVLPTATERVVVVTATPPPATVTATTTATAVPATLTPIVIVVTATFPPTQPTQPLAPQPTAGFKYPAPVNVSPANGAGTPARCQTVTFSWSGPALSGNEWYVLEKTKADHPNDWNGMTDWTQNTSKELGPTHIGAGLGCYYAFYDNYGTYLWHVVIVSGTKDSYTRISPPSQPTIVVYGP